MDSDKKELLIKEMHILALKRDIRKVLENCSVQQMVELVKVLDNVSIDTLKIMNEVMENKIKKNK